MRTVSGAFSAGRHSLGWNGRDNAGRIVPAGTYRWYLQARDVAGNTRLIGRYTVGLSWKRLTARVAYLTKNADAFDDIGSNEPSCTQYSMALSFYAHGVWLYNFCDPDYWGYVIITTYYTVTLPAAVRYGSLTVQAYGSTLYPPSEAIVRYRDNSGYATNKFALVTSRTGQLLTFGSVSSTNRIESGRRVEFAIGVDDAYNSGVYSSDFDISWVRLKVVYYVFA